MEFAVKSKLEEEEYRKVLDFLSSIDYYCIEQHPVWNTKVDIYPRIFFVGTDDQGLVNCFGNILITSPPFKTASIRFGPAFKDFEVLIHAIEYLHNYFTSQKFIYFSIQLGTFINNKTELLEYEVNKKFNVRYQFKPGNLWASTCVDITRSEDEIFKSFSRNHERAIKKAVSKFKLTINVENDPQNLQSFIDLYFKMMVAKKLHFEKDHLAHLFNSIHDLLYHENRGFFEYIFHENTLVGGMIIIYQGKIARSYKGMTDPERGDIPIFHFGYFEAMKICKKNGYTEFDLGGYNHFAEESDQTFSINRFKHGFRGEFTFYPKRMNFVLKPTTYKIYNFLKGLKRRLGR